MPISYVFIRILEACNADCFMCIYRLSKEKYRFTIQDMKHLLNAAVIEGVEYIRLTGGEPLAHREIGNFVSMINEHGIKSSIITNGLLLEKCLPDLVNKGLNQIIVSIDGNEKTHDTIRGKSGIYQAAIDGLKKALSYPNLICRVNTVVGPHNFREMKDLQNLFTDLGVHQWELSSIKLERKLEYTPQDINDTEKVAQEIFELGRRKNKLIPLGKAWCGETIEEKRKYFEEGVTPRADNLCMLVNKVRYIDAKNKKMYCCSLISHRPNNLEYGVDIEFDEKFSFHGEMINNQVKYYNHNGPSCCTGCSTTAAGFSNTINKQMMLESWGF